MQVINTIREQVFESLKGNPIKLHFAKTEINQLEQDLEKFNENLAIIIDKYSEFLPSLKVSRQVCDKCQSSEIILNKSLIKKFKERMMELDIDSDKLLFDYEKVAIQVKQNEANRMPNKDFVLLCILLKNKQVPPNNLSIPSGESPMIAAVTKCKDVFEKLEWDFPSQQIADYVCSKKTKKIRSSLKKIL